MKIREFATATALFGAVALLLPAAGVAGAAAGNCQSKATTITAESSKTVKLVNEWDVDNGEHTDEPVYWFKFSASKGKDYTFYTVGLTKPIDMWITTDDDEFHDVYYGYAKDGVNWRATFKYDPDWWESGMKSTCTYYICITGDEEDMPIGSSVSVALAGSIVKDDTAPLGSLEKPSSFNADQEGTISGTFLSTDDDYGCYAYTVSLTGGKDYYLQLSPNTEDESVDDIDIGFLTYDARFESYSIVLVATNLVRDISDPDRRFVKYIFTPASNSTYCVQLSGSAGSRFQFKHELEPKRTIGEHTLNGTINPGSIPVALTGEVATDAKCSPKTRKYPADSIYDDAVIDKELYGFKLTADRRYVFWTESAGALANDLVMELYDSNGRCIASNVCCTAADKNVAMGFQPTTSGTYYVGIAQTGVVTPADLTLTFKAAEVGTAAADLGFADAFDFGDSNYLHSTVLSFSPDSSLESAPHTFSRTDWEDWMRVDARKGVTYTLRAETASGWVEPTPGISLVADVYTLSGAKLSQVVGMGGLNPYDGITLPSNASTTYFVKFSVVNGAGLRYGPYKVVTSASAPGGVGLLKVNLVGPETGAIQIVGDAAPAPSYLSGAELIMPNGNVDITFVDVKGYTRPSTSAVTVSVPGEYTFKYKDEFDPKDDDPTGATELRLVQSVTSATRTLVDTDPRDIFKVTSTGLPRYKFWLDSVEGAVAFSVTNAEWGVAASDVTVVSNLTLKASTAPWYVVVAHAGAPVDSSYTLKAIAYTVTPFTPTTSRAAVLVMPTEGESYHSANLVAGRKYSFSYTGNAKLEIEGEGERIGRETSFSLYPSESGRFVFRFTEANSTFTFSYSLADARSVRQHTQTGIAKPGTAIAVKPKRVNSWLSQYDDNIPDECLYKVTLARDKTYLISATGATTNIVMRVYDTLGNLVAESWHDGATEFDVRALVEKATAGQYTIGLAQVFDEKHEEFVPVPDMTVSLLVSEATQKDTATPLDVSPNKETELAQEGFGSNRWTRTYSIAGRKGVTYRLWTTTGGETGFTLAARAYKKTGTIETKLTAAVWTGVPADDGAWELNANENATYYVELWVDGAKGCDYPAFSLWHEAVGTGGALGKLKVDIKGGGGKGQWYLGTDMAAKYDGGASVLVVGDQKVTFTTVQGFATPASTNVSVKVWKDDGDETTALGVYTDTYDHKDDVASGATMLTVSATAGKAARTLFADDPEDNFSFTASASAIYSFRLEQEAPSDAVLMVSNASRTVVAATGSVGDLSLSAVKHWVVVRHADDAAREDSEYTLVSVAHTPTAVRPAASAGQAQGRPVDGVCYFTAQLKGGSKYVFALGDSAASVAGMWTLGGGTWKETPDSSLAGGYGGFAVYPDGDDTYVIKVSSSKTSAALKHKMAGARTLAQHTVLGTLSAGVAQAATPGYVNNQTTGSRDGIIDDCLYKVQLASGKKYLVSTSGAATNLLLRVYNSQGAVVAESRTDGVPGSFDARVLVEPTMAGAYYVGLAQDGLDEIMYSGGPLGLAVSLLVSEATQEDDVTALDVNPNKPTDLAQEGFGSNRWTRTYSIAGRKGVTYRLKTTTGGETDFTLAARAYKLSSGRETKLTAAVWTGVPAGDGAWELNANENATYYVELWVDGAKGCDYPAFSLRHEAVGTGGAALGKLKVDIKGGGGKGQWYLGTDMSAKYDGGASVLVVGDQKVTFTTVQGFATPASTNVSVKVWKDDGDEATALGVYTDTYDHKDDVASGATMLTVSAKNQTVSRTLWQPSDPADWFSIRATKGTYYDLSAVSTVDGAAAPLIEVYRADGTTKVAGAASTVRFQADAAAKYLARVVSGDAGGTAYTLAYSSRDAGTVSLDKGAYSVSSSAGSLEVKVSRTSSIGALAVRYSTLGVSNDVGRAYGATAEAGVHYDTVGGTLEWADGDKAAKSVKIPIVAELYGRYRGDKKLFFEIRVVPGTGSDAGYDPVVVNSPAEITIKDSAKNAPGTIGISAYDAGAGRKSLAASGSATVATEDGGTVRLYVTRSGGSVGAAGVRFETVAGTAGEGSWPVVSTNLVWGNWEDGDKAVDLAIPVRAEKLGDKTFDVRLTPLTGEGYVAAGAGRRTATVKISDRKTASTFVLAKAPVPVDKNGLVSVSTPDTGTWFKWSGTAGGKYRIMVGTDKAALGKGGDLVDDVVGSDGRKVYGLVAGSTYYWRVDTVEMDGDTIVRALTNSVWTFKAEAGIPYTTVTASDGSTTYESGSEIELVQLQSVSLALGASAALPGTVGYKTVGGTLPPGLTLKSGLVSGVPSTPGEYTASFQATGTGSAAATTTIKFTVKGAGVAVGTFSGLLRRKLTENQVDRLGSVTVTVTRDGKISAKAGFGQTNWSFSGTGFSKYLPDDDAPVLSTVLFNVSGTTTNTLSLAVPAGSTNSLAEISAPAAIELDVAGTGETATGTGYRAADDLPAGKAVLAGFKGYYTVSLPSTGLEFGVPSGAGYVTATIDDKGAARLSGVMGDGSSLMLSAKVSLVDETATAIVLPIYSGAKTRSFGGYLVLRMQGGTVVADAEQAFEWHESDASKTYAAVDGFSLALATVGGLYDTLLNLQTYYLDRETTFDASAFAGALPNEIYPAGCDSLLLYPGAGSEGVVVTFSGNGFSVPQKSLKYKQTAAGRLVDFYESTNASGVSTMFTRSTGVFSGTFSLWFGNGAPGSETVQREVSNFRYGGVLVPTKDSREVVFADYPGMGYVTSSVRISSRSWTGSWLIGLLGTDKTAENAERRKNEGKVLVE